MFKTIFDSFRQAKIWDDSCDKIERLYSIKKKEKQYIVKMSKRQIDLLMCCELNGITNTNEFNKRLT